MIAEKVRLEKELPMPTDEQMESIEFFKESMLNDVILTGNSLVLKTKKQTMIFEKLALGEEAILIEILNLNSKPFAMDFKSLRECNTIRRMLGDNWDVNKIDKHYVLANSKDTRIMVIK